MTPLWLCLAGLALQVFLARIFRKAQADLPKSYSTPFHELHHTRKVNP